MRMQSKSSPSVALSFVIAWPVFVAVWNGNASAQNLPEVEMDQAGPKQIMPLGKQFVLTGKISTDTTQVQAVFVRYAYYPFGAGSSNNICTEIADGFTTLKQDTNATVPALFASLRGINSAEDVWQEPPSTDGKKLFQKYKTKKVYLPSPWERPEDEEKLTDDKKTQSFRIVVGEETLFRPGSHTCLFLYERHVAEKKDTTSIPGLLKTYINDISDCPETDKECRAQHTGSLVASLQKLTDNQAPKIKQSINQVFRREYYDAAIKLVEFSGANLFTQIPGGASVQTFRPNEFLETDSSLGSAVVELLAFNNLLQVVAQKVKSPAGGDMIVKSYFTNDGKTEVKYLALQANNASFVVAPDQGSAINRVSIKSSLATLKIPDSEVSMESLVELSKGRLLFGGKYLGKTDLEGRTLTEWIDDKSAVKSLRSLAEWLDSYHSFLARNPNDRPVYAELRTWFGSITGKELKRLQDVQVGLVNWADAIERLQNVGPIALKLKEAQNTLRKTGQRPLSVSLDQRSFVTNFITPVVGRSFVFGRTADDNGDGNFVATYLGVQVFLFPNPIDEPMWRNGFVDVRRLFGLELGVSLGSGDFGDDGRVTSASKQFPPLFAGLALQPLPYVSVSFGAAIFGVKRTALEQEESKVQVAPYLGVSIQANIPDLVRALSITSGATPQSVEGGKK